MSGKPPIPVTVTFAAGVPDPSNTNYRYAPPRRLRTQQEEGNDDNNENTDNTVRQLEQEQQQEDRERNDNNNGNFSSHAAAAPAHPATSNAATNVKDIFSLAHGSYSCPGFSGPGSNGTTHIEALPFSFVFGLPPDELAAANEKLLVQQQQQTQTHTKEISAWKSARSAAQAVLAHKTAMVIPLYQRGYTWLADTQGVKWFDDMVAKFGKVPHDSPESIRCLHRHGTGKVVMKLDHRVLLKDSSNNSDDNGNNNSAADTKAKSWVVVDGQQRVTTMSLLFAALYEVACDVRDEMQESTDTATPPAVAAVKSALSLLEQTLFIDVDAARSWAKSCVVASDAAAARAGGGAWPEGMRIPGARLIPSHVDRAPFFELITRRFLSDIERHEQQQRQQQQEDQQQQRFIAGDFTDATKQSLQGKMMLDCFLPRVRMFVDRKARELLQHQKQQQESDSSSPVAELAAQITVIERLTRHLLWAVGMVLVELTAETTRVGQVFLWLQEKSLFGQGALLWNPAPGIHFIAVDLLRNALLSPSMDKPLLEQEALFERYWLRPVEIPVREAVKRAAQRGLVLPIDHQLFMQQQQEQQQDSQNDDDAAATPATTTTCPMRMISMDDYTALLVSTLEDIQRRNRNNNSNDNNINNPPLFKSAWQRQIETMVGMLAGKVETPKDISGLLLYTRFYSAFEERLQHKVRQRVQEDTPAATTATLSTTLEEEAEVCQWFLQRAADAAVRFNEILDSGEVERLPRWRQMISGRPAWQVNGM